MISVENSFLLFLWCMVGGIAIVLLVIIYDELQGKFRRLQERLFG